MKSFAIILLTLVASMIVAAPLQVYADAQLDSLLRIAMQARDNIKIRLSQFETVPNEISTLYEQASAETDELEKSVLNADVALAKQHFLTSMKLFREASDLIETSQPTEDDTARLKTAIIRIENDANRLKNLATKNNIEIDFTEFDNLIQIAKQNLESGNLDEVNQTLAVAKQFIIGAYASISDVAKQRTSDRAKNFAAKQIENLDKLISQAVALDLSQDIIDNLQIAKEKLQKISDPKKLGDYAREINTIKEKIPPSTINRLNNIIHKFELKIEDLNEILHDDDSKIKIKTANNMIVELKQFVLENKLKDALHKISSINEILNGLEALTGETEDTSTSETTSMTNRVNNADSKLERIKTKIQTLEEKLNKLSETISDNEIAIKWIKRGFSLLETAKLEVDKSTDKASNTLSEIEKIILMIQKITS
ncbi:MAG: hypothetical protein ACT4N5_01220 [Nitrosopumilaceae archaeon]